MAQPARDFVVLLIVAIAAILIQGYHFASEDGAIYVPAIARFAHPRLYPFGAEFFLSHGHLSIFAALAGGVASLLHLSIAWSVLLWYVFGTWLMLIAAWQMAGICFQSASARWIAVGLLAAVLPVQVAGTAIPIMDAYFTARTLSTPLTLLALAAGLRGRWLLAVLCIVITLFVHPQMAFYAAILLTGLAVPELSRYARTSLSRTPALPVALVSFGTLTALFPAGPATAAYRDALYSRTYLFARNWTLPQWIGVICPLLILLWISSGVSARVSRGAMPVLTPTAKRLCFVLVAAGVLATAAFLLLSSSLQFDSMVRLQPMRIFQLVYIVMFLILGGLAGHYLLRGRLWRTVLFFLPLAVGMYALDRSLYPASEHIEWPGLSSANPWLQAFAWIRQNTPEDAVFAIDPEYMLTPGEDSHGFRALTQRSVLADAHKDSGVATMFPAVAPEWGREFAAQQGWRHFTLPDFERLATVYPVTWVAVAPAQAAGLDCRYSNSVLSVCRIPTHP